MKTRIVSMGTSRGVRIPKSLLEQTGLTGEVEIHAQEGTLVIRPVKTPRALWSSVFQEMARQGDDTLLDAAASSPTDWDKDGWEWS